MHFVVHHAGFLRQRQLMATLQFLLGNICVFYNSTKHPVAPLTALLQTHNPCYNYEENSFFLIYLNVFFILLELRPFHFSLAAMNIFIPMLQF